MLVYILKQNGQPFMPTSRFGKVRRLLKEGKAKVVRREPLTIKLLYEPLTDDVQDCYCGVDTGSKHVGVAVVGNDKVLYQSQIELRTNIRKKMGTRRMYRRLRRFRKTRYRKPRFLNRRNSTKLNRLPPSIRHKIQAHIDEIGFCKKILPISDLILEVSQFDTALMKNPALVDEKVRSWGYQQGHNPALFAIDYDYFTRSVAQDYIDKEKDEKLKKKYQEQLDSYIHGTTAQKLACVNAGIGIDELVKDENETIRREVASKGYKTDILVNDTSPIVRSMVALRKEYHDILSHDEDATVRSSVAACCNKEILSELATDSSSIVRQRVASRGNLLSKEEFDRLLNDENFYVRESAKLADRE